MAENGKGKAGITLRKLIVVPGVKNSRLPNGLEFDRAW